MPQLLVYAAALETAMVAVGVYGAEALQSLRRATARMLVAISLGVIFLSVVFFVSPPLSFWRSNLLYAMGCRSVALVGLRILLGKLLGGHVFKRRIVVLGAGARAARLKALAAQPGSAFVVVGYISMSETNRVIPEAIARDAIYNLADHVVLFNASEVVLALEERRNALPLKDLLRIKTTGVHVNEISTFLERETGRVDLQSVNPSWLIFSDGFSSGRMLSSVFKRLFDIGASAVAADPGRAAHPDHRDRDQAREQGAGLLSPAPRRAVRRRLRLHQVALDAAGRRGQRQGGVGREGRSAHHPRSGGSSASCASTSCRNAGRC